MINVFTTGFLISAGLLVAIGPQNTYVLRQGIKKEAIFTVSTVCFLCDTLLMTIGVFGLGKVINDNHIALILLTLVGFIFLIWYGYNALVSAWKGNDSLIINSKEQAEVNKLKIISTTVAMSLLNPNVWLDTVAIVGSISLSFAENMRIYYLVGALTASFVWFYSIGYLSSGLSNILSKKKVWQVLDLCIGIYMLYMAFMLLASGFSNGIFS
ncbi:LysE/ArgO family amino acid transporter [Lonepinella koalarum]|uniref:L-lysine exporter family protein LysE/ArgO n=1 Tax=Lonepinella koalarum TaxID=53417 RepID=A0A4R1L2V9_9PAST|nr:LysE/ArgO family amino acid transporter [Lonepinella koalarum]MDH2926189.1 lysine transporter LysE [Lonepinella koalarum]TCK71340.1 L-lysine exporter family protein LysE/ArgO [Lonepinella koalarum]TFJ91057.1 amino acid transporter [Lonepinella koalarum]